MVLQFVRLLFLLTLLAIILSYISGGVEQDMDQAAHGHRLFPFFKFEVLLTVIGLGFLVIAIDILMPRKSLAAFSGLFVGLLAGLLMAFVLSMVLDLIIESMAPALRETDNPVVSATKLLLGAICCYLSVSVILQTKDDVRFIIPYVEFSKQTKGGRPMILDTSAIIDGRIADITHTKILDNPLIVPRFVLQELHNIADSADRLKRNRGRRGLDMLNKLQADTNVDITIHELSSTDKTQPVDHQLLELCKKLNGKVVTHDYNLNKIAKLQNVEVININDLANALKTIVLPGETLVIKPVKHGEEPDQAVGYLDDGTMVVAQQCGNRIGQDVTLTVTSVLQTSAGRMVFGRPEGSDTTSRPRRQTGNNRRT